MLQNGKRTMARIAKIDEVKPIENADQIDAYRIDGWWVVDKKGAYNIGDLVVYISIDSFIPHELAPFLSKGKEPREFNGVKGERLRTVRLRGQISQGLLMPLEQLFPMASGLPCEGQDVTDILGIQKWDPPIPVQLAGLVEGPFPLSVPRTDEERVQNLVSDWSIYRNNVYEVTEKLEGSSMTVGLVDDQFVVCSRNLRLRESESNTFWRVAHRLNIEQKMRDLNFDNVVLQGELVGEGIQGNHYKLRGADFYVFSVYDILRGEYLPPSERRSLVSALGLNHVPVVEDALDIRNESVDSILKLADGFSQLRRDALREGLVFKSIKDSTHWKAVSNSYLLKSTL
jgi:RNA ligase (TIGR02306 family)